MLLHARTNKLISRNEYYTNEELVFESNVAGTYSHNLKTSGVYEVAVVGGSGAAAMRGVYDDRGYGWSGGSGGAFVGTFVLNQGTYNIVVGKANTNTAGQGGNTNTMNPSDTTKYPSSISGVVTAGGGGSGTTSGVGAAGDAPTLTIQPLTTSLNTKGNAGAYGSGGKGSGPNWTHNGAASVYEGHGKGQGCSTSEYAGRRYWIAGTPGYVRIKYLRPVYNYIVRINSNIPNSIIIMNGVRTNRLSVVEGTTVNYEVSADGYNTQSGSIRVLDSDKIININLEASV